jgi:hypothetical protein
VPPSTIQVRVLDQPDGQKDGDQGRKSAHGVLVDH